MKRAFLLLILLLCAGVWALAQHEDSLANYKDHYPDLEEKRSETVVDELEILNDWQQDMSLSEEADGDAAGNELLEELTQYANSPLDLNTATNEQLQRIGLNQYQIFSIRKQLAKFGKFVSVYELLYMEGFSKEDVLRIEPFVTIYTPTNRFPTWAELQRGKHTTLLRFGQVLEEKAGYAPASDSLLQAKPNSRYLGGPQRYLLKYTYNCNNKVQFGFTAEKDAGERFLSESRGFDFYSFHFYLHDVGNIKALALGDYLLQFGQGLVMWTGFKMYGNMGGGGLNVHAAGIKPHKSATENNFLRGGAITIGKDRFSFTAFASHLPIDAVVKNDSITSIKTTGLHNVQRDLNTKHAASQTTMGGHVEVKQYDFKLGITALHTRYSHPLNRNLALYQKYVFNHEQSLSNLSVDYSYSHRGWFFYGETAMSDNHKWATINGVDVRLSSYSWLSLQYRNYDKAYHSVYAGAYGIQSQPANEQGLCASLHFRLADLFLIDALCDRFSFPWLSYNAAIPAHGTKAMVQICNTITRKQKIRWFLRYKYYTRVYTNADKEAYDMQKHGLRMLFKYKFNEHFEGKTCVEKLWLNNPEAKQGLVAYQDVSMKFFRPKLSLSARYVLFNTDDYASRIYAMEQGVRYAFNSAMYYYKGSRWYLVATYKPSRHLAIYGKLSQTRFKERSVIGSGLEQIDGNTRTEVTLQLIWKV